MPKRTPAKQKLDANQTAVRLLNAATGSKPVNGEDLLPPHLAVKLRDAKAKESSNGSN